jgi:dihydrolipoamide dehydrogenase
VSNQYDLVVIGAGTGGYVGAIRAAQLGLRVGVVERAPALGGTCLNWGCIPTKALLEHAHVLDVVRHAKDWGVTLGESAAIGLDLKRVHARKDKIVKGLTKGVEFLFKKNGIDWIKGSARLAGTGRVEVVDGDRQMLTAREILVATGSAPRSVPGIEIDRKRIITSDEALNLREVPASMAIVGSGAVGVEFASIYRRFGSNVTLIEILPRIVPNEDEAVSAELEKSFRKQGIAVLVGTTITRAAPTPEGVDIEARRPDGTVEKLRVDYLLVAAGRGPVTDGIGAAEAGLALDRGYIQVDEQCRTNVPGISAVGDVITIGTRVHPQLAHLSSAEGILVAERVAGREAVPIDYDQVPACTYCDPEIGSVGLTEREAAERGFDVRVGSFPMGVLGRAKILGETDGFVKIVAESQYDEVLGIHMIGARATELVAEAAMALRLESTVEEIIRTIHAHPTMAEAVAEAAHAVHGAAINV